MKTSSPSLWMALAGCLLAALGLAVVDGPAPAEPAGQPLLPTLPVAPTACLPAGGTGRVAAPLEQPMQLGCEAARKVVAQARRHLVEPPARVDPREFADTVNDWFDPHGLWSAAPDAPVAELLGRNARKLLAALERGDPAGCEAASQIGARMVDWIAELGGIYDQAMLGAERPDPAAAWRAASEPAFDTAMSLRPARALARDIGQRAGLLAHGYGDELTPALQRARTRLLPGLTAAQWGQALLAASVRAYVILIDPHGAWAPLDEESSLYEVELEASGRTRLWQKMSRTAAGVRIEEVTAAPLLPGDLVLSIAGITTAGLSVEQVEQLGILDPNDESPEREVVVLRQGAADPIALRAAPPEALGVEEPAGSVSATVLPYGDGESVLLKVSEVPDDLGDQLASVLAEERGRRTPAGVVLDLRGNGGGSTDGARTAIGLFLPGVPLFPMRRRDGSIEIEHAPRPTETDRWEGPVAVLVDGATASAAEMIAGALGAYRRAVVIGTRTYGKGCAQEYMDDEVGAGVLRLTTLVYALPDGTPVQRVGLAPSLSMGVSDTSEREGNLPRTASPWRAPDMRDRAAIAEVPWPPHGGRVGPCAEELVCKSLRAVGSQRSASSRGPRTPGR